MGGRRQERKRGDGGAQTREPASFIMLRLPLYAPRWRGLLELSDGWPGGRVR